MGGELLKPPIRINNGDPMLLRTKIWDTSLCLAGVSPSSAKVGFNLFAFVACLVVKVGVFSFVVSDRI